MAWIESHDGRGASWKVNHEGVWHIVRANTFASELLRRTTTRVEAHLIGPDLHLVETDFHGLNTEVDRISQEKMTGLERQFRSSGGDVFAQLVKLRSQTLENNERMRRLHKVASDTTMRNVHRSIERTENALTAARVVRDLSATTIVVGASIIGGVAGTALLATGSLLKGTAKYQDTGNVGEAVVETASTVVVGLINIQVERAAVRSIQAASTVERLAAQASTPRSVLMQARRAADSERLGHHTLLIIGAMNDGFSEFTKSMVAGHTIKSAVVEAATRMGVDLLPEYFHGPLSRITIPVVSKMTKTVVGKVATDLAGDGAVSLPGSLFGSSRPPAVPLHFRPLADSARTHPKRPDSGAQDFVEHTAMHHD
jgi:hypothetical protein